MTANQLLHMTDSQQSTKQQTHQRSVTLDISGKRTKYKEPPKNELTKNLRIAPFAELVVNYSRYSRIFYTILIMISVILLRNCCSTYA